MAQVSEGREILPPHQAVAFPSAEYGGDDINYYCTSGGSVPTLRLSRTLISQISGRELSLNALTAS